VSKYRESDANRGGEAGKGMSQVAAKTSRHDHGGLRQLNRARVYSPYQTRPVMVARF
jgi:hypothetical protein